MSVAIWPLLSRNVVVDHASFSGVKARVVRDKQGHLNFQDLLGDGAQQDKPTTARGGLHGSSGAAPRIDIAGLDIKGRRSPASGTTPRVARWRFRKLNAKTGRVRIDESVRCQSFVGAHPPRYYAAIQHRYRRQGLRCGWARRRSSATNYEKLDLKASASCPARMPGNLTARGDLAYDGQSGAVDAGRPGTRIPGGCCRSRWRHGQAGRCQPGGRKSFKRGSAQRCHPGRQGKVAVAGARCRAGHSNSPPICRRWLSSPTTASGDAVAARAAHFRQRWRGCAVASNGITGNSSNLSIVDTGLIRG